MSIDAAKQEQDRLGDPGWAAFVDVEEQATRNKRRQWRTVKGMAGYEYRIDDSDPARVYVHMKVYPRAKGAGTAEDVKRTVSLEDGIETAALEQGYLLDVEFVKHYGRDVFPVGVDPSKWITAGNWVGPTRALAHEAHHLLNLEDRYDYLHHAENEAMSVETRLHWFREQMVRGQDPLREQSIMGSKKEGLALNEQDVCALVGSDYRECLIKRFAMRSADEIEALATPLSHPYRPQNAALLEVMAEAWGRRPFEEITADCAEGDPLCGLPPLDVFGGTSSVATDAARFPLANPHEQPEGKTLTRTSRP